jgi:Domain of unknown function (DUF4377)
MNKAKTLLLLGPVLLMGACGGEQEKQTLRLSHYMTPCIGVGEQLCYVDEGSQYYRYDGVAGWTFHWGTRYELQVKATHVSHPLADAPSTVYDLVKETAERVPAGTRFSILIFSNTLLQRVNESTFSLLHRRDIDCAARGLCEALSASLEQTKPCVRLELSHPAEETAPLLLEALSTQHGGGGC